MIRQTPGLAPHPEGVLIIDEISDLKDGTHTAYVGRQYLGNVGQIGQGVVSVSSLWADERVYYPLNVLPYTPSDWFPRGKKDPAFRTKLALAIDLMKQAVAHQWPSKAVVADSFYGEDAGLQEYLHEAKIGFVMALKPSHSWWYFQGGPGSTKEIAEQPEQVWQVVERVFRDGHRERWWALEIQVGPYGPRKPERAVVVTTDPKTLPELSTWYLVTNLPLTNKRGSTRGPRTGASLEEVVACTGCGTGWSRAASKSSRRWAGLSIKSETIEPSCGIGSWSTLRSRSAGGKLPSRLDWRQPWVIWFLSRGLIRPHRESLEPISHAAARPWFGLAWPAALRQVRSWLEPACLLKRYWSAYSPPPPPFRLQELLAWLRRGNGINVYSTAYRIQKTTASGAASRHGPELTSASKARWSHSCIRSPSSPTG